MKNVLSVFALLAVFVVLFSLTGAIAQECTQSVQRDGSAFITKTTDVSLLGSEVDAAKVQKLCAENANYGCQVENGKLSITVPVESKNTYYTLQTDYGILDITYTFTLNAVPNDLFSQRINALLVGAGYSAGNDYEASQVWKKNENLAQTLKTFGDISYTVTMPGEVIETSTGSKTGSTATFLLSDVLSGDGGAVVKSRELNWGYIILIVLVLVLAGFAASLLIGKKEQSGLSIPLQQKQQKKRKK